MRRAIRRSVGLFAEAFAPTGPIVELGSLYLPGYEALSDLRDLFPGRQYIGCDIRQGLGVDRIEDAEALRFDDRSVETLLLLDVLEHLPHPQKAIAEAHRVLRDDGLLALSTPFNYRLHGFPSDYWRFTASGIHTLLQDFPDKVVFALGPRVKPAFIFAVAAKRTSEKFCSQKQRFQTKAEESFRKTRPRGYISALKERGRDFFGCLLGRAEFGANFFNSRAGGGYASERAPSSGASNKNHGETSPRIAGRSSE